MAYNTNFDASNKADLIVDISATDAETGDDIDFTGAEVAIAVSESGETALFSATIGSGITQPTGLVLELTIPATFMATLTPGSYQIDGIYKLNGTTEEIFIGTIAVHRTAASL